MIAEAVALPAAPQPNVALPGTALPGALPALPGAAPAPPGAAAKPLPPPARTFLPLLLGRAAAPPGDGKPRGKGARTAQSEGADKHTDTDPAGTDSTGPVAPLAAPLAAVPLQVPLPVPLAGAPTHTDDAQEQGAGAHDARIASTLALPPAGPAGGGAQAAAAPVVLPQLPQEAAVDAARPVPEPASETAARVHAPVPAGGTRDVGETRFPPRARLLDARSGAVAPAHDGHRDDDGHAAAIDPIALTAQTVDATTAAPAAPAAGGGAAPAPAATPTAFARLGELPASAAALLEVATGARATRARIVLTPPELGKVEIRLRYGADGVSATFHADSPQAAQSLAGAAGDLRRSLETQGIPVVRIDVPPAATGAADQQGLAWAGDGGGRSADPGPARGRSGRSGRAVLAAARTFVPDDPITLRAVLLGTAVDVLA